MNHCVIEIITLLVATIVSGQSFVSATKETMIPVNDIGEGSQCDQDQKVANTCLACSALSLDLSISLVECCSDESALAICSACVDDNGSCIKFIREVSGRDESSEEDTYDGSGPVVTKRFGRLFMKSPRKYWGRKKRYGTLFMKSPNRYRRWFGKRDGDEITENLDKRYGRLYLGNGNFFGKRDGDKFSETPDYWNDLDKMYDQLYLGNGGYFENSGKRDGDIDDSSLDDSLTIQGKRYGRLFIGDGKGYFGKRDADMSDVELDKRFGRLFLGSGGYYGKRSYENDQDFGDGIDKRYGRLFVGSGRYLGKRDSPDGISSEYDFNENPLSYSSKEDYFSGQDLSADKRFGKLFMGGKFGRFFKTYKK